MPVLFRVCGGGVGFQPDRRVEVEQSRVVVFSRRLACTLQLPVVPVPLVSPGSANGKSGAASVRGHLYSSELTRPDRAVGIILRLDKSSANLPWSPQVVSG